MIAGRQSVSFESAPFRGSGEESAEAMVREGMLLVGLSESDLVKLRPSDLRKQALVWLVKTKTVVGNAWVAERLAIGNVSNISRAMLRMKSESNKEAGKMRRIL